MISHQFTVSLHSQGPFSSWPSSSSRSHILPPASCSFSPAHPPTSLLCTEIAKISIDIPYIVTKFTFHLFLHLSSTAHCFLMESSELLPFLRRTTIAAGRIQTTKSLQMAMFPKSTQSFTYSKSGCIVFKHQPPYQSQSFSYGVNGECHITSK